MEPRPPKYFCVHCNKFLTDHHPLTDACPVGIKRQSVGAYTSFHSDNVFRPDLSNPRFLKNLKY